MNSVSQQPHFLCLFTTTNFSSTIVALLVFQLLTIYPIANCLHYHPASRELLFEEKTRLGSRPPSCHNKCNQCHPCMAVQVPTLPGQSRAELNRAQDEVGLFESSSMAGNSFSNYKPLGWKCQCKDHLFNP